MDESSMAVEEKQKALEEKEKEKLKVKRSKRLKPDSEVWNDVIGDLYPDDASLKKLCVRALESLQFNSCEALDIAVALTSADVCSPAEKAKSIIKAVEEKRCKPPSIPISLLMVDKEKLEPLINGGVPATFFYVGLYPVKATINIPALAQGYSVQEVNGYCGEVKFTDTNGWFILVGDSYMFEFESQQQCSKTDEELHDILYYQIRYDYDATNKYVDTMFSPDNSPGKSFFRTTNVTVTKDTNDVVSLNIHKNRSAKEMDEMRTDTVSESCLTASVIEVLHSNGLKPMSHGSIRSNYCPFSGGEDIEILNFNNSAVLTMPTSKKIRPNSPPADGEVKVSFDMEFKRSERSNKNLVKELIANMMVVAAMSLEKVCSERVQSEIKSISTYGLAVDLILPLQLFKLTIDFDRNRVVIINKQNVKLSADCFLEFDKLLTYMIRNCVHTF